MDCPPIWAGIRWTTARHPVSAAAPGWPLQDGGCISRVPAANHPTIAAIHLNLRSGKVANLPAFLRHFTEARPLLVVVSRRFQSRASRAVQLAKKMAAPIVNGGWDVFSFYLYHVGGFNVVFKTSYTLDFIAALIRSPIYALPGLALRANQCKVLFWSWFAKEAMLLMMTSLLLLPLVSRQKHKWHTGRLEQGKYVTFSLKLVVRTSVPSKWMAA